MVRLARLWIHRCRWAYRIRDATPSLTECNGYWAKPITPNMFLLESSSITITERK